MDKFENEISKKLESIKSEVVHKDWDRFSKKFPEEKKSIIKLAFQNIYKIAAILLITSLISMAGVQYFIISDLNKELEIIKIENTKLKKKNIELQQNIESIEAFVEEGLKEESTENEEIIDGKAGNEIANNDKNSYKSKKVIAPKTAPKTKTKVKFFQKIKLAINKVFSSKKDSTAKAKK
jgi:glutamate synthase domain-containing protein 2